MSLRPAGWPSPVDGPRPPDHEPLPAGPEAVPEQEEGNSLVQDVAAALMALSMTGSPTQAAADNK
jgi:hypothetical protein